MADRVNRVLAIGVIALYVWGHLSAHGVVAPPPLIGPMIVSWRWILLSIVSPLLGAAMVFAGEEFGDYFSFLGFGPHSPGCMVRLVGWVLLLMPALVNIVWRTGLAAAG